MENQSKTYTIITGGVGSGKSRLAKQIADWNFKSNEVTWIDGRSIPTMFMFQNCNENTKLLIIDNVKDPELYIGITEEVIVHRQSKITITIHPEIILICNENINPIEFKKSITRRFNIIKV